LYVISVCGRIIAEVVLSISRDRNGDFEPKIVPKYKRDISGIEEKIISLCKKYVNQGYP